MKPMTRDEIDQAIRNGAPMPNRFTGVWKGQHYYLGQKWSGPSNEMGGKSARFGLCRNTYTLGPGVKLSIVEETCITSGGLVFDGHGVRARS